MAVEEQMPKASDVYLGVVDLFAIILPGAIMVYLLAPASGVEILFDPRMERASGWVVLLVVSYILGHIVFALGALFLDEIYDNTYKLSNRKERHCSHRIRAVKETQKILKGDYLSTDNALEWASCFTS